jgi:hypothetical protein
MRSRRPPREPLRFPLALLIGIALSAAIAGAPPAHLVAPDPVPPIAPEPVAPELPSPEPPPAPRGPVVRERARVVVDGVTEEWRLEWQEPPKDACFEQGWSTCPCYGFAFGEQGRLDLVRARPGAPDEHLPLGERRVQRWPELDEDRKRWLDTAADAEEVKKRPEVTVMHFADYDHDGRPSELVFQVEAGSPCMRTWAVLIGLDRRKNRLQIYGTAEHPEAPILFEHKDDWETLRSVRATDLTQVGCGDHFSYEQVDYRVRIDGLGFHVDELRYDCIETKDPSRWFVVGRLRERKPLHDEPSAWIGLPPSSE